MLALVGGGVTYGTWVFYILLPVWGIGLLLGSVLVGTCLLIYLGFIFERQSSRLLAGIGLGLFVLSYSLFLLSAMHLLYPWLLGLLIFIWCGCGWVWGWRWLPRGKKVDTFFKWWEWYLLAILLIFATLNLLPALTPAVDWDGLAYHLALPKLYLQSGGFIFRPDIFHNLLPQFTEMLFLTGLWLPFGIGAKVIHWGMGVMAAATLWSLGREQGWRFGAWIVALVFYLQFLVHVESGTAFIDLAGSAYVALAMLILFYAQRHPAQLRWLYLGVFFLGVNAAIKWHGMVILELGLLILMVLRLRGSKDNLLPALAWMFFWGHLPVLPYCIRAWLQGGNPIWPLAFKWFGGRDWNLAMSERFAKVMQLYVGTQNDLWGWIKLPYELFMQGEKFGLGGVDLKGPMLGFLILGLVAWVQTINTRKRKTATTRSISLGSWLLVVGIVLFSIVWFFSSPQVRFLLPLFPLAAWMGTLALYRTWHEATNSWVRGIIILAGTLLVAVHPPVHRGTIKQGQVFLGYYSTDAYITQAQPHYPACQWLNQNVKSPEKVLLFGENRGFYLDVPYLWGDPALQCVIDYTNLRSPQDLAARLRTLGITWLLLRDDVYGSDYLSPAAQAKIHTVAATYGRVMWSKAGVQVVYLKL